MLDLIKENQGFYYRCKRQLLNDNLKNIYYFQSSNEYTNKLLEYLSLDGVDQNHINKIKFIRVPVPIENPVVIYVTESNKYGFQGQFPPPISSQNGTYVLENRLGNTWAVPLNELSISKTFKSLKKYINKE